MPLRVVMVSWFHGYALHQLQCVTLPPSPPTLIVVEEFDRPLWLHHWPV